MYHLERLQSHQCLLVAVLKVVGHLFPVDAGHVGVEHVGSRLCVFLFAGGLPQEGSCLCQASYLVVDAVYNASGSTDGCPFLRLAGEGVVGKIHAAGVIAAIGGQFGD